VKRKELGRRLGRLKVKGEKQNHRQKKERDNERKEKGAKD
jgi:hypothetical protein